MNCTCVEEINEQLPRHSPECRLETMVKVDGTKCLPIYTVFGPNEHTRGRRRLGDPLYASYCPFCGKSVVVGNVTETRIEP